MAKKKIDFDKLASGLFKRTEVYADRVRKHYVTAVDELLKLAATANPDGSSGAFSFADNTRLSNKANEILRGLYSAVYNEIQNGVKAEWEFANVSCDALITSLFGKGLKESGHFARWFSRNQEAMDAFLKRKGAAGGLNLSKAIWKYTGDFRTEMETALSISLGQGDSASTVSRKVRHLLQHPDDMFRRFRVKIGDKVLLDEHGNPILDAKGNPMTEPVYGRRWKKKVIDPQTGEVTWQNFNPRDYHTGRGVYRSSYKNAMRLTRTETNMAYRTSEQERWQQLEFVVGYEIKTSNNHPIPDICDELKGKYPKSFMFRGWHPQCRCYCVPILANEDEFINQQQAILDGEEHPATGSVNEVTLPPKNFDKWIKENEDRVLYGHSVPYFIRENPIYVISSFSPKNQPSAWEKIIGTETHQGNATKQKVDMTLFKMTSEKLQGFIDRGIIPNTVTLEIWEQNPINGLNPERLISSIKTKAEELGMTVDRIRIIPRNNSSAVIRAEGNGFEFSRRFDKGSDGTLIVEHSYFTVDEEFQGKGFSKTILRSFYQEYRAIGVSEIEIHANIDVGGYAWARYGFQAKTRNDVVGAINWEALTKKEEDYIANMIDDWYKDKSYTEPFPIKKIADLTYGRKALLNGGWHGVINLRDDNQRRIFENYLGI